MIGILGGELVRLFYHSIEHFVYFIVPAGQIAMLGIIEVSKIFRKIQPNFRFSSLTSSINDFSDEHLLVFSFLPRLGNVGRDTP